MSAPRGYDDLIMDHIKNARGYCVLDDASHHASGANPLCGDEMTVYVKLDGDRKWPTDDSLRAGMAAIHVAFAKDHPAIHAGTETDAQYETLAGQIEAQVNEIVAKCSLPPAADANLHFVIADLLQGVSLMRGSDAGRTRHDGAALVHGALRAYGQYFDDPGWGKDSRESVPR